MRHVAFRIVLSWLAFSLGLGCACWENAYGENTSAISVWTDLAPGETTRSTGSALPRRPRENPPATRIEKITAATLEPYLPPRDKRNGTVAIICPGGGYRYVVVDKEGSEVAGWLNRFGVSCFVLKYRTKLGSESDLSQRPLQDMQRSVRLIRSRAEEFGVDPQRIGVIGFSAGGNLAALAATRFQAPSYRPADAVDQLSCRPDFAILVYPWMLWDEKKGGLRARFTVAKDAPPAMLVHAHDDRISSLNSIEFYAAMRRVGAPAELHVYQNGGHGFGMRPASESAAAQWTLHAENWLRGRKLISGQ